MNKHIPYTLLLFAAIPFLCVSCTRQKGKQYSGLPSYNFSNPTRYVLPDQLTEISGIAFSKGDDNTIYAEQDEQGKLYQFHIKENVTTVTKFGKSGDYEDLALCNGFVIVLKSNGTLCTFPLSEATNEKAGSVQEIKDQLGDGEYEGLYADEVQRKIYVVCKHCSVDKPSRRVSLYLFDVSADGLLRSSGECGIDVKQIEKVAGIKKLSFQPSALAKNPLTNQWFILSSMNKMLVIADEEWQVKEVHQLNPAIFLQPEGMAFDSKGNLYISNEGDALTKADILQFEYTQQ